MTDNKAHCDDNRAREKTPEPQIIPSQHRLQHILELGNTFNGVNKDELAYYQSQGLIFANSDGDLFLATPFNNKYKSRDD